MSAPGWGDGGKGHKKAIRKASKKPSKKALKKASKEASKEAIKEARIAKAQAAQWVARKPGPHLISGIVMRFSGSTSSIRGIRSRAPGDKWDGRL